ncbi:MAG: hypothetical protein HMLKMBBP_00511 [Planctomycetes bacterium]|nr:hypothetical protein [Planctomycetota bacterium]
MDGALRFPRAGSRVGDALRRVPRAFAALLFACVAATAAPARADVEFEVQAGHGGVAVRGSATPVSVTLKSRDSAAIDVTVELRENRFAGAADVVHRRTVRLPPGAERREVFLYPGPDSAGATIDCRVSTSPRTTVIHQTRRGDRGELTVAGPGIDVVLPSSHTIAVVGDSRKALASRLSSASRTDALGGIPEIDTLRWLPLAPETLRLGPLALDGVETVLLCDPDSETTGSPAETDALLDWVALGGRLVISLGDNAQRFASSPLAPHLPATWSGSEPGDLVLAAESLGADFGKQRPRGAAPGRLVRLAPRDGAAPPRSAWRDALFAERRIGRGRVILLGADLRALAVLLPGELKATRPIVAHLADLDAWDRQPPAGGMPMGRTDLREPLSELLRGDAFRPPSRFLVFLGLVAYLLVVGPLDWFILRRMKKERLTTVTFTVAVLVFSVVAYGASFLLFGADAQTNRIVFASIEDGAADGRLVARVHEVVGAYQPVRGTRELKPGGPAAILGGALPGIGQVGGVGTPDAIRVETPDAAAQRAEVTVGFRSQRVAVIEQVLPTGRAIDARREGSLWTVENGLPVALSDAWLLLAGGRAVRFGPVAAGGSATGAAPVGTSGLRSQLERDDLGEGGARWRQVLARAAIPWGLDSGGPEFEGLLRAGIARVPPGSASGAVLVAFARESPFPLSAAGPGATYVVLTREIPLR